MLRLQSVKCSNRIQVAREGIGRVVYYTTRFVYYNHYHFQLIGFEFSDYRRLFSVAQPFLNVHQLVAFLGNDRPHFMGVQRLFDEFLAKVELHRRVSNHRIARQHELTVLLFGQLHHRRHDFAQRAHHLNNAWKKTNPKIIYENVIRDNWNLNDRIYIGTISFFSVFNR